MDFKLNYEICDSVEKLESEIKRVRKAQAEYAKFSQILRRLCEKFSKHILKSCGTSIFTQCPAPLKIILSQFSYPAHSLTISISIGISCSPHPTALISIKWFAKANKKISAYTVAAQTAFYNMNIQFKKKSFMYMGGLQNLVNKYPKKQRQYKLLVGCGEHDIPMEIEIVNEWAGYEIS